MFGIVYIDSDYSFLNMEFQATVCCSKIEADADNEDRFKRRSILTCFGATVGLVRAYFLLIIICVEYDSVLALWTQEKCD